MPSSASSGVREAPLPVVPGREAMAVRLTLTSYFDGLPYSLMPAPGDFIHAGVSGGSNASAPLPEAAVRPLAPSITTPCLRKCRRGTPAWDRSDSAIRFSSRPRDRWTRERIFEYFPVLCKCWRQRARRLWRRADHEGARRGGGAVGSGARVIGRGPARLGRGTAPCRRVAPGRARRTALRTSGRLREADRRRGVRPR